MDRRELKELTKIQAYNASSNACTVQLGCEMYTINAETAQQQDNTRASCRTWSEVLKESG